MCDRLDTFVKDGREELIFEEGKGVIEAVTGRKPKTFREYVRDCVGRKLWG